MKDEYASDCDQMKDEYYASASTHTLTRTSIYDRMKDEYASASTHTDTDTHTHTHYERL